MSSFLTTAVSGRPSAVSGRPSAAEYTRSLTASHVALGGMLKTRRLNEPSLSFTVAVYISEIQFFICTVCMYVCMLLIDFSMCICQHISYNCFQIHITICMHVCMYATFRSWPSISIFRTTSPKAFAVLALDT